MITNFNKYKKFYEKNDKFRKKYTIDLVNYKQGWPKFK